VLVLHEEMATLCVPNCWTLDASCLLAAATSSRKFNPLESTMFEYCLLFVEGLATRRPSVAQSFSSGRLPTSSINPCVYILRAFGDKVSYSFVSFFALSVAMSHIACPRIVSSMS
jgi:hypothetical protein